MDKKTLLSNQTIIKTNLEFVILIGIMIFTMAVGYTTLKNQVGINTEQVRANSSDSIDTRIKLAEIQTQLEANGITLTEIKAKLN